MPSSKIWTVNPTHVIKREVMSGWAYCHRESRAFSNRPCGVVSSDSFHPVVMMVVWGWGLRNDRRAG